VKFAFIEAEKANYPIQVLCAVLAVSRSGYYAWSTRPQPPRAQADAQLAAQITASHKRSRRTYGSPRVPPVSGKLSPRPGVWGRGREQRSGGQK